MCSAFPGRGTVVTGRVERGIIRWATTVEIVGIRETTKTVCTGVEMFRKLLDEGQAGDNIGRLLRGTKRDEVERGQVVAAPGSITPHTKFKAECTFEQGRGRSSHAVFQRISSAVLFPDNGCDRHIESARRRRDGDARRQCGDQAELITPIAMEKELRFAIREGGRTVGAGVVSEIIE
jgi:elongation factor Tu